MLWSTCLEFFLFSYLASGYLLQLILHLFWVFCLTISFFTEPYFTLQAYSPRLPDYLSYHVYRWILYKHADYPDKAGKRFWLKREEERIKALYHIGRQLLGVKNQRKSGRGFLPKKWQSSFLLTFWYNFFDPSGNVRNTHIEGPRCLYR